MSKERDFYRANVDAAVDRRLLHHAFVSVRVAQIESRAYPDMELDAVPEFRRLNFNSALLLSTYPAGAGVERIEHPGGSHAVIRAGGVVITNKTRSHMPRKHSMQPFEETLATGAQFNLFGGPTPQVQDHLWGFFIFGGDYRLTKPSLAVVTFPTPEGKFAPGAINLLAEYPDVVATFDDEEYAQRQALDFIAIRNARRA